MHARDGVDESGFVVARRCPKVLNDWTQGQPKIDLVNRWRQHELAMEKRILTESFPARLFIFVLGTCVVNSWLFCNYFLKGENGQMEFRAAMRRLARRAMHNDYDARNPPSGGLPPYSPPAFRQRSTTPKAPEVAVAKEPSAHVLVSLRTIEGFKERSDQKQMDCVYCQRKTSYACACCSEVPYVMALCPAETTWKGETTKHPCLTQHRRDPSKHSRRFVKGRQKAADEDED